MKINFELVYDAWREFNKYYIYNSKEVYRTKLFMQLFVPVPVILIILYKCIQGALDITAAIILLSFSILWFLFYSNAFYKSVIKKTEKLMKEGDNTSLFGNYTITFDETGFTCTEPLSTQTFKWPAIKKAVETKNHFFLFNTAVSAIIIPKKTIQSESESLRNLINQYLNEPILQQALK